jgi:hypothetical protein
VEKSMKSVMNLLGQEMDKIRELMSKTVHCLFKTL